VVQLVAMFNPVGAVLKAIQVIYQTITFFMEKAKELAEVAKAVVNSVAEIADGNLTKAANFVEQGMAKTIPPMLDFLARLVGLDGIGKTIRNIIEKIQAKVDAAIGKVLDFIVNKAKALLGKAKEGVVQAVGWWKERRSIKMDGQEHSLYMDGTEDAPQVMIASDPSKWEDYKFPEGTNDQEREYKKQCDKIVAFLKKPLVAARATDKLASETEKAANIEERRKQFNELARIIAKWGLTQVPQDMPSQIFFSPPRDDGGGVGMVASFLSPAHGHGTGVGDTPPIWNALGKRQNNYIQGHLLNNNLGGEGKRFNLTPITRSANGNHLNLVERHVKMWVNEKKKPAYYSVIVDYKGSPAHTPPAALAELLKKKTKSADDQKRISEYEAELRLARNLICTAYVLKQSESGKWVRDTKADGEFAPIEKKAVPTPLHS
jgi:hypothetical protein